jgi:DNA-binding NarL/FixJ family response regulator
MEGPADGAAAEQLSRGRLRLLVVDDHELILWGTRVLLCRLSWVGRCLQASDGAEAVELARRYEPHVAIVDLLIGEESGLTLCATLRHEAPGTKTLLTSGVGEVSRPRALAAGASGFVPKEAGARELVRAVRAVHSGLVWFPACPETPKLPGELSPRERDVLQLIALGCTNRQIAARLHLSPDTVKQHTSSVYRKLDARNRAAAVHVAQQIGLVG